MTKKLTKMANNLANIFETMKIIGYGKGGPKRG